MLITVNLNVHIFKITYAYSEMKMQRLQSCSVFIVDNV